MSETKGQNNKLPENKGAGPTRSFDGSIVGAGNQIGSFRIEKELGRGGAGVVYLAHDTKLDRSVAIKSLPAELMENPKARTRFAREARVLASLNHPNIATIYEELNVAEGFNYLVLEYVSGQTLAERISGTNLKPQEALSIAQQIAEAIAAAYEHDVIHRDLKPENIKITLEGKVKVLDFGLAKALGRESEDLQSTVTEPGRIIGTPAYMSPEQARGQMADKRCDIWAFGCILYEMLTGRCAFPGKTVSEVLVSILTTDPDWQLLPPETLCVRGILNTCLQKDPDQRYQSATALLTELHDCSESLRVSVNKLLNVKALSAMLRRPKLAVSIVLLLMMLAAGISWRIHKERKIRWAREVVMPAILDLTREARYAEAFLMAREAERYISNDLMLARLWPEMSRQYSVTTNPSGAKLAYKEYSDVSGEWIELGNSPSDFMLPFGTYRWMILKSGYVPLEFVKAGYPGDDAIVIEIDFNSRIDEICEETRGIAGDPAAVPVELENLLVLGKALAKTAIERKESRGGFYREDYPVPAQGVPEAHILTLAETGEVTLRKEILDPLWNPDFQNMLDKERWG